MSAQQHGCIAEGGNGVYQTVAFGGHLQLVGNCGHAQTAGRRGILGLLALKLLVVHTVERSEGLPVEPPLAHNAILVWAGSAHETGHCRSSIGVVEWVFCTGVHASFLHQALEATVAVEGREGLHIVGPQLVDDDVHYQAWHLGCGLCVCACCRNEDEQRGEQLESLGCCYACHFLFLL